MFLGWSKQLIVSAAVLSLCVGAAALPTVIEDTDTSFVAASAADTVDSAALGLADFIEPVRSELTDAGRVLYQPFDVFGGSTTSQNNIRKLPACPGAVLLGLTGFLCITLVRDRKTYIAIFIAMISLSQQGIYAVPELAARFGHAGHIAKHSLEAKSHNVYLPSFKGGLLLLEEPGPFCTSKRAIPPVPAVPSIQSILSPLTEFPVERFTYIIPFSPAFTFTNLARGPPRQA